MTATRDLEGGDAVISAVHGELEIYRGVNTSSLSVPFFFFFFVLYLLFHANPVSPVTLLLLLFTVLYCCPTLTANPSPINPSELHLPKASFVSSPSLGHRSPFFDFLFSI